MTARLADRPVHWGEWPDWLDDARDAGTVPACDGADQALFFPDRGGSVAVARAICRRCPLEDTCKAWALEQPAQWLYGVWGGTTRYQRLALAPPGEKPASLRKHNR